MGREFFVVGILLFFFVWEGYLRSPVFDRPTTNPMKSVAADVG